MDIDKATATQLANIEKRTGKTLAQLEKFINASKLTKHGEIVALLKSDLGMGHGDAKTLVHVTKKAADAASGPGAGDVLDVIYTGPKAHLRPVHDALMKAIDKFGPFEIAPKKGYVSLRGKKQFAMIGPATNTQVEIGLNMKGVKGTVAPRRAEARRDVPVQDSRRRSEGSRRSADRLDSQRLRRGAIAVAPTIER